jgi:hypothetical protein
MIYKYLGKIISATSCSTLEMDGFKHSLISDGMSHDACRNYLAEFKQDLQAVHPKHVYLRFPQQEIVGADDDFTQIGSILELPNVSVLAEDTIGDLEIVQEAEVVQAAEEVPAVFPRRSLCNIL